MKIKPFYLMAGLLRAAADDKTGKLELDKPRPDHAAQRIADENITGVEKVIDGHDALGSSAIVQKLASQHAVKQAG